MTEPIGALPGNAVAGAAASRPAGDTLEDTALSHRLEEAARPGVMAVPPRPTEQGLVAWARWDLAQDFKRVEFTGADMHGISAFSTFFLLQLQLPPL